MDRLTESSLKELIQEEHRDSVTMFLRAQGAGAEERQSAILLKNMIQEGEYHLVVRGMRPRDARRLLEPVQYWIYEDGFRENQNNGMVLFLASSGMKAFRTPWTLASRIVVNTRFYVAPLIPLVTRNVRFHILALSPSRVRLLRATRSAISEVELPDCPSNLHELKERIPQRSQLQFHTATSAFGGDKKRNSAFHGQAGGTDDAERKARTLEFCQRVDRAVRKSLVEESAPLLLACDRSLAPIYRRTNSYRYLADRIIPGCPDGWTSQELRAAAEPLVEAQLESWVETVMDDFRTAATKGQASDKVEDAVLAAQEGRVRALFVADRAFRWGRLNRVNHQVEVRQSPLADDEDLLNLAAVTTYLKGGAVYVRQPEEMPSAASIAALYRY